MSEATIGVIGMGELSQRMIRSTFNDQLEAAGDDGLRLILPVTKDHFTDEVMAIADWAIKNEVPIEVVTDSSTAKFKVADDYVEEAVKEHSVKSKVADKIVSLADKAGGKLFFLWDADDDETYASFEKADEDGVDSFDLCHGLEKMTFGDEGDDEPEEEETETEPEGDHSLDEAAEMGRRTVKDLKAELDELGVSLRREGKGRIGKAPHVAALMGYRETGFKHWLATPDGDDAVPDEDAAAKAETEEIENDPEAMEAIAEAEAELEAEEAAEAAADAEDEFVAPDEDDDVEIPSADDDEALDIPQDKVTPTSVARQANPYPMLTGACGGCGGPIFAQGDGDDGWPEVGFFHADGCSIQ